MDVVWCSVVGALYVIAGFPVPEYLLPCSISEELTRRGGGG